MPLAKHKAIFLQILVLTLSLSAALYSGCGLDIGGQLVDIPEDDAGPDTAIDSAVETAQFDTGSDDGVDVNDVADANETEAAADSSIDSPADAPDADPPVPTCTAGNTNTVDYVLGTGSIQTALLIHFSSGSDHFFTATPSNDTFTGKTLPGQAVVAGKGGIQFGLKNGINNASKPFYLVTIGTLPVSCAGSNLYSQACAADVAKSFRCQHAPYNEKIGCPAPVTFTAQPANYTYTDLSAGDHLVVVDLTCGP